MTVDATPIWSNFESLNLSLCCLLCLCMGIFCENGTGKERARKWANGEPNVELANERAPRTGRTAFFSMNL